MSNTATNRAEVIFLAALELPVSKERAAYVTEACGADARLFARVQALLEAHEQGGSFLEKPPTVLGASNEVVAPHLAASLEAGLAPAFNQDKAVAVGRLGHSVLKILGQTMDVPHVALRASAADGAEPIQHPNSAQIPKSDSDSRYRLDGEIARGGMGAIIKGRDNDLGRDLAIKVLLDSHKGKPEVIQRFVEEAQIGGQLQHPGIAPIYELGQFADKRPFFAMKLVKGQTLAKLLADREDAAEERGKFIGIFEQVCQTMAYAHSRGVIHRDLKPANIMVGAFGEVQVMDWGLAKVLQIGGVEDEKKSTALQQGQSVIQTLRSGPGGESPGTMGNAGSNTQVGSVMGTPAYMPPEQALGEIDNMDERADVFGLGAILCEILTGKPPYVAEDGTAVFRMASRGKLADCWDRLDDCDADVELTTLARHCLEVEPRDRPRDAGVLTARVVDYIESVESKLRESEIATAAATARAEEERKRRQVVLALAASIVMFICSGGGVWLWAEAEQDARKAELAREVNETLHEVIALREQAKMAGSGGEAFLANARSQVERALTLADKGPIDPVSVQRLQEISTELDELERARNLIVSLHDAWLFQTQESRGESGMVFAKREAAPLFLQALLDYGLPVGAGDPNVVAGQIRKYSPEVRKAVLSALFELYEITRTPRQSHLADAGNDVLEGHWISTTPAEPLVHEPHRDWILNVLKAAWEKDSWEWKIWLAEQAPDESRQAKLEEISKSVDLGEVDVHLLTALADKLTPMLAKSLLRRTHQQNPHDFWINFELGLHLQNPLSGDADSKEIFDERMESARYLTAAIALQPENSVVYGSLGNVLDLLGQIDQAVACYEKAIELNPTNSVHYSNLCFCLMSAGRIDEAIAAGRKSTTLSPQFPGLYYNLAGALRRKGEQADYIATLRQAVGMESDNVDAQYLLGRAHFDAGELEAALETWKTAERKDPRRVDLQISLGVCYRQIGDLPKAVTHLTNAARLNPGGALPHANLGIVFLKQGRIGDAAQEFNLALRADPDNLDYHLWLILGAQEQGKVEQVLPYYESRLQENPQSHLDHIGLGHVLLKLNRKDEALQAFRKAAEFESAESKVIDWLAAGMGGVGEIDEALVQFRRSLALNPSNVTAQELVVRILFEQKQNEKDPEGFIVELRKLLTLKPNDALVCNLLAWSLLERSETPEDVATEARKLAKKACDLDPDKCAFFNTLAVAHYRLGDWESALSALRQANALSPTSQEQTYNDVLLAMVHWQLKNIKEARKWYDTALKRRVLSKSDPALDRFFNEARRLIEGSEASAESRASFDAGMWRLLRGSSITNPGGKQRWGLSNFAELLVGSGQPRGSSQLRLRSLPRRQYHK
ncbi:MAG: tetratricopeptide repeat protein [Planctomycetales bacterium]|nr:tetratricopeptide repeat protein [Planctomycetales bacterium]